MPLTAKSKRPVAVIGGGLAGLMAALKIAETGTKVLLFSLVPVKRSHSVCAQGGINAAKNLKGEGDSPDIHFDDTIYGGDFLANQYPVREMCYSAPRIVDLLDRMGVMFNRTPEGLLDFRRFGGTLYNRTAFAGASTGQQILYALDEQVRRFEADGLVEKYEFFDFLEPILDDTGTFVGLTALDMRSMKVYGFEAGSIIVCTGGPGLVYGKSTNSMINTGTAVVRCYNAGVTYANGEFIQVHPTAIPGVDKLRLMSESIRGEGGRMWVPKIQGDTRNPNDIPETDRWFFLEEKYPKYGNLVPRDIATREIFHICVDMNMGIQGKYEVFLDISHLGREVIDRKLGAIAEIYERFMGVHPADEALRVFPGVHYSMGGLWVADKDDSSTGKIWQMTNVPGIFSAGESEYQYHGANRLGANSLLSCIYGGEVAGLRSVDWARTNGKDGHKPKIDSAVTRAQSELDNFRNAQGKENPYQLHRELGLTMTDNVTVVRDNDKMQKTLDKIAEIRERANNINVLDHNNESNQALTFIYGLQDMITLAEIITLGAIARDESRGSHYKPNFPDRDDQNWLKTTLANKTPEGPKLSYEPVDISLIKPRPRVYTDE